MDYKWEIWPYRRFGNLIIKIGALFSILCYAMIIGVVILTNWITGQNIFDFQSHGLVLSFIIPLFTLGILLLIIIMFFFGIKVYCDSCALYLTINDTVPTERKRELYDKFLDHVLREYQNAGLHLMKISFESDEKSQYYTAKYDITNKGFRFWVSLHRHSYTVRLENIKEEDLDLFHREIKVLIERSLDEVFSHGELENRS